MDRNRKMNFCFFCKDEVGEGSNICKWCWDRFTIKEEEIEK